MALITCPECEHKVSSQANTCPNCAYPIKTTPTHNSKTSQSTAPDSIGSEANPITIQATSKEFKVKQIWALVVAMIGLSIAFIGIANWDLGLIKLGGLVFAGAIVYGWIVSFQAWYRHG